MFKPAVLVLRFALAVGLAAVLGTALEPAPGAHGPYASALSDLATPALAAGSCGNRACDATQFRTCVANPGTRCKLNVRTAAGCATIAC